MTETPALHTAEATLEAVHTRRHDAYPEYRPSGIEWLGDVPEHWEVLPVRRKSTRIQTGSTPPTHEEKYYEEGSVAWYGPSSFTHDISVGPPTKRIATAAIKDGIARLFGANSVLVVTIGATLGKVAWLPQDGSTNQQITAITLDDRNAVGKYIAYQLKLIEKRLRNIAPSATLPILDTQEIASIPIAVPPLEEQQKIARFLDEQTEKIDGLIGAKRDLLALLKEKRQAVVNHAVTKGLDPAAKLKLSGVEWLGDVPEHWDVVRLKQVAQLESGHTPSRSVPQYWENCTIPWVSLADVGSLRSGKVDYVTTTKEKISQLGIDNSSARLLPAETVILSRTASVGFPGIISKPMATTQDFVNWICGPRLRPRYLLHCLRSMRQEFEKLTMGSTHQTIYMPDVRSFKIPLPPLDDQKRIDDLITNSSRRINALTAKLEDQIVFLREYRTSLISAAVTGKIDVRGEGL